MMAAVNRPSPSLAMLSLALALCAPAAGAQDAGASPAPAAAEGAASTDAGSHAPRTLQPFVATYEAYNEGKRAGNATMRLVRGESDGRWRIDLEIDANRGFVGVVGLNIDQSTAFDVQGDRYRPLSQATVRKALFFGREITGTYDWAAGSAQWTGDLKKERRKPIPLQDGDMSALLINLAFVRDAEPGRALTYRFVDGGRVRTYEYVVAPQTEPVEVEGLSYEAMRVSRTNGGNDGMTVWIADGVPTPVRILQSEDGQDGIDLRLIEYTGA